MKTYIFPGQGSQYVGMGKKLFAEFPNYAEQASDLLGYSISELCLADPNKQLNHTQFTQPALYTVSALAFLQQQKKQDTADYLAGHSLGEYAALFAAGAISFESGLKLVQKRGELMSKAAPGAMAAVLNVSEYDLNNALTDNNLNTIDIANLNAPEQIVISGLAEDIDQSQRCIEQLGGRFIKLNTSGAFHSRYMAQAKAEFADFIQAVEFAPMHTPVIANVTATPYQASNIPKLLIDQITQPVQWTKSIEFLLSQGDMCFLELGPKKVLTKLVQTIEQNFAKTPQLSTVTNSIGNQAVVTPQQQVTHWNNTYPIGTEVFVKGQATPCKTRSQAILQFGHRPTIYLHDYSGYFHLNDVSPVATSAHIAATA
ncbi:ACP S-malonyltransferase [Pseudoalteromonas luteoviolacea]|uniref:ACP S-malonyltransferase n=1 Tax=Pseudoalteromonas luteoviolacea TaxID=43657 RepID=UPI001B35FB13|nr:ACP S-malonyltransferase [Pseudoalteromonas luteoviolacea]MBQ4835690.1 ACP S-malonyltransferase [Pseudoalteromonas luteoviolacea]